MKVLLVKTGEPPVPMELDGSLESMQAIVGGYIQVVYPFDDPVALVCNDEGKINGMPLNRALRYNDEVYDVVAGDFLIVGLSAFDFEDLTDELMGTYAELFKRPEQFVTINGHLMVIQE